MRLLTLAEVLTLYDRVMELTGGAVGIRDIGMLESALAQQRMTVGGADAYPSLIEKVAAVGFSFIQNHPFVDGNKRIGHAVMELTLLLNGVEIVASVDDSEALVLAVASGGCSRNDIQEWLSLDVRTRTNFESGV